MCSPCLTRRSGRQFDYEAQQAPIALTQFLPIVQERPLWMC